MNLETFKRDIKTRYKSFHDAPMESKLESVMESVREEWSIEPKELTLPELQVLTAALLEEETSALHDTIEDLLAQKERLERQIARKNDEVQNLKYSLFNTLEKTLGGEPAVLEKLHQIKLQSIDLLDLLEEMVESAIITTLEKGSDIEETLHEIVKEITFQSLNASVLNAIRIRRILASILQSAINIAEATPNQAETILRGTLLGIRTALIKSIEKFRQYLLYLPDEVKALYRDEYKTIQEELSQIETLLTQVLHSLRNNNSASIIQMLEKIGRDIRFDAEEITALSKETVDLLHTRLSRLTKGVTEQREKFLNSKSAQEAKAMGVRAWSVAKSAMNGAIQGAKDAMDKK